MSDFSILLCGEAGQGIQTVEQLFTKVLSKSGFYVFSTKEYMSRVRGGSNSTQIRISTSQVYAYIDRIDILIPLSKDAIDHVRKRISDKTLIIGERDFFSDLENYKTIEISFSQIAKEIGNVVFSNTVAVGLLSSLFNVDKKLIISEINKFFSDKTEEIVNNNILAVEKGYVLGQELIKNKKININVLKENIVGDNGILLNGTQAVGFGAIAGGCNFISSYPMSPSTGVLNFLSEYSDDFEIIVEQAEDEISAVNMALGAWYAGARAIITTSGGGYALMIEGISLAGMIESPIVIHLAQRPGPATGLPTRTEQSDIEHVLYSGHGEFPRIIFAPGTLYDAFYLTQRAFDLADKFQIPVFILTDQYFVDSYYNIKISDMSIIQRKNYFIKTSKDYRRYQFSENGISPRGIPGYGKGLVCLDSDEHDENGHIAEDADIRIKMVNKRLRKIKEIEKETLLPDLKGSKDYKILVIGWGSTYHIIEEALKRINNKDISFLHFKQIYPIHKDTKKYLSKADITIIVENNATSQFGKLIKLHTGFEIHHKILQFNGLPFSVETIESEIKRIIGKE